LEKLRVEHGLQTIANGTNADDLGEFKREMDTRSPIPLRSGPAFASSATGDGRVAA
jgi:hypothetical protein